MARIAHIDSNGKVVNVIVADEPHRAPPPPDGLVAVVSDQADVGLVYDGQTFIAPELSPTLLAEIAHSRFDASIGNFIISLAGLGYVNVDLAHFDMLHRAAIAATTDPHFSMDWPQPQTAQGYVTLNAQQIIALNNGINETNVQRTRVLRKLLEDIKVGKIKRHTDLYHHTYAWPKRSI